MNRSVNFQINQLFRQSLLLKRNPKPKIDELHPSELENTTVLSLSLFPPSVLLSDHICVCACGKRQKERERKCLCDSPTIESFFLLLSPDTINQTLILFSHREKKEKEDSGMLLGVSLLLS